MPEQNEWEAKASNILKAQLKLKGVSYAQLAELIGDKEPNVRNKLSRGKFSAAYFIQCLESLKTDILRLR
ncbi:MAG: DUF6471 domain-containing protein [Pseudomonadota bacterium]